MSETFARQWAMLKMIPKHPRTIDSVSIRERLRDHGLGATNLRTIQRDLEMLSQSFPIAMVDPGKRPIQWHWTKGAAPLDIPALDPAEAVAMKLVETYLRPLLPGAMLDALTPHFESAERVSKATASSVPRAGHAAFACCPKACSCCRPRLIVRRNERFMTRCFAKQQLELVYRPRGSKSRKRYRINPLGLVGT